MKLEQASLLNCLSYYDTLILDTNKTLGENLSIIKKTEPYNWKEMINSCPAGLGNNKAEKVLEAIINDPYLSNLNVLECTRQKPKDSNPIAFFLSDDKSKEAICLFRGTNAREWMDNADGFAQADSFLQKNALYFFQNSLEKHQLDKQGYDIYTSGHSKGGNKSMYIALMDDRVKKCFAFDGQGFSNEFIQKYKKQIVMNSQKITNYAANKDIVSALGNSVGREQCFETNLPSEKEKLFSLGTIYKAATKIPGVNVLMAHSPGAYFHFDENGNVEMNEPAERSRFSKNIHDMSLKMMERPIEEKKLYFESVMSVIQIGHTTTPISESAMMSNSKIQEGLKKTVEFINANGMKAELLEKIAGSKFLVNNGLNFLEKNKTLKEPLKTDEIQKIMDTANNTAVYQEKENGQRYFVGIDIGNNQIGRLSNYQQRLDKLHEEIKENTSKNGLKQLYKMNENKYDTNYSSPNDNQPESSKALKNNQVETLKNDTTPTMETPKKEERVVLKQSEYGRTSIPKDMSSENLAKADKEQTTHSNDYQNSETSFKGVPEQRTIENSSKNQKGRILHEMSPERKKILFQLDSLIDNSKSEHTDDYNL